MKLSRPLSFYESEISHTVSHEIGTLSPGADGLLLKCILGSGGWNFLNIIFSFTLATCFIFFHLPHQKNEVPLHPKMLDLDT